MVWETLEKFPTPPLFSIMATMKLLNTPESEIRPPVTPNIVDDIRATLGLDTELDAKLYVIYHLYSDSVVFDILKKLDFVHAREEDEAGFMALKKWYEDTNELLMLYKANIEVFGPFDAQYGFPNLIEQHPIEHIVYMSKTNINTIYFRMQTFVNIFDDFVFRVESDDEDDEDDGVGHEEVEGDENPYQIHFNEYILDVFGGMEIGGGGQFMYDDDPHDVEEDGWIRDLTDEGIEPNPGPSKLSKMCVRHNCSSTTSVKGLRLYNKMLSAYAEQRVKTCLIPEYELSDDTIECQMGDPLLPGRDCCPRCGQRPCVCTTRHMGIAAHVLSAIASLLKIIRTIMVPEAQMGWFSGLMTGGIGKNEVDRLVDGLDNIPTLDSIRTMVEGILNEWLDADCGVVPIKVRSIVKMACTLFAFYIVSKFFALTWELVSFPIKAMVASVSGLACAASYIVDLCKYYF